MDTVTDGSEKFLSRVVIESGITYWYDVFKKTKIGGKSLACYLAAMVADNSCVSSYWCNLIVTLL